MILGGNVAKVISLSYPYNPERALSASTGRTRLGIGAAFRL